LLAAGAVWRFWQLRAHFAEARSIFDELLAQPGATPAARAKALIGAGGIAYWQADYALMKREYQEARELYESVGDRSGIADALYNESYVPLLIDRDIAATRELVSQARDLYAESGNVVRLAEAESALGFLHFFQGEPEKALPYQLRAVEGLRQANAPWHLSDNLIGLAWMYAHLGDWQKMREVARESMALAEELGIQLGLGMAFQAVAGAAAWTGDLELAARLRGKADEITDRLGATAPSQFFQLDALQEKARRELGEERHAQLHAEGAQLTLAEARELAEGFNPPVGTPPVPRVEPWGANAELEAQPEPAG